MPSPAVRGSAYRQSSLLQRGFVHLPKVVYGLPGQLSPNIRLIFFIPHCLVELLHAEAGISVLGPFQKVPCCLVSLVPAIASPFPVRWGQPRLQANIVCAALSTNYEKSRICKQTCNALNKSAGTRALRVVLEAVYHLVHNDTHDFILGTLFVVFNMPSREVYLLVIVIQIAAHRVCHAVHVFQVQCYRSHTICTSQRQSWLALKAPHSRPRAGLQRIECLQH